MSKKTQRPVKLSEAFLASLPTPATRVEIWDTDVPGLLVRVTPAGRRTFCVRHRVKGGGIERVTIGPHPQVSVRLAREKAKAIVAQLATGHSFKEERQKARQSAASKPLTLGQLWNRYFEEHARPYKRSAATDARRWRRHLSEWAHVPLAEITTGKVAEWLVRIKATSGPGSANRVRALLSAMFTFARRQLGLAVGNPVLDTPRSPERSRERYLLPGEVRRFVDACRASEDVDAADFAMLALFTGARSGSLCAMRWRDLDLRDGMWMIPAQYMKAGRELQVPLCKTALAILRRREKTASGEWVFPGASDGHLTPPRAGLRRILKAAEITTPTTFHDLRRTFATYGVEGGAGLGEIARLLGHSVAGGVTAVYARTPMSTLRRAVERIELALVTAGRETTGTVVAMQTRRKRA